MIVKDLIVGNRRQVSDLAGMLSDLRKIGVIDKELHSELKKTKAGRNMFTHEHDMDADLPHTLEAIKTMRLLATLTDPIDDPAVGNKRRISELFVEFLLSRESEQYFNQCLDLAQIPLVKEHKFTQALWFNGLQTRLPVMYTQIPFDMAKTIGKITALKRGLDGDSITEKILKDASRDMG